MAGSKRCASHQYTTSEDCKRLPKTESAFLSATSTGFLCEFLPSSRDNSQLSVQLCRILPSIEILRSAKRSLRDYRILPASCSFCFHVQKNSPFLKSLDLEPKWDEGISFQGLRIACSKSNSTGIRKQPPAERALMNISVSVFYSTFTY